MKRSQLFIVGGIVLGGAAWAQAAVLSDFSVHSEGWYDTGSAVPGYSSELGPDGQPGVLAQRSINAPSFPDINSPNNEGSPWLGDWQNHAGPEVNDTNLLMSMDIKWINADYPGTEWRVYTQDSQFTIWKKTVGNPSVGLDQWDHIEEAINTEWTDAEANAHGWVLHQGPHSFAQTFSNVTIWRTYPTTLAPNLTEIRYDNISLGPVPEPVVLGDMDDDGDVDNFDILAFELALTNPSQYAATYPGVDPNERGDVNENNTFGNDDIGPFEALLTGNPNLLAGLDGTPSIFGAEMLALKAQALGMEVPEPASLALLAMGGALLMRRSARR